MHVVCALLPSMSTLTYDVIPSYLLAIAPPGATALGAGEAHVPAERPQL